VTSANASLTGSNDGMGRPISQQPGMRRPGTERPSLPDAVGLVASFGMAPPFDNRKAASGTNRAIHGPGKSKR